MAKGVRSLLAVATAFVLALGAASLSAQTLSTSDAAKFIGAWTLGLDTPQGALSMNLTLKDAAGKVAGTISSDMLGESAISQISKDGDKLVLQYEFDYQGQAVPTVITIAPQGDKWTANFDFAGGQFTADGTAVKK